MGEFLRESSSSGRSNGCWSLGSYFLAAAAFLGVEFSTNFDKFRQVSTSFDEFSTNFRQVSTNLSKFRIFSTSFDEKSSKIRGKRFSTLGQSKNGPQADGIRSASPVQLVLLPPAIPSGKKNRR